MFGLVKDFILGYNESKLRRLRPEVNIYLSKDLPIPSIREIRKLAALVSLINSLEAELSSLSDHQLQQKTKDFRQIIQEKEKEYAGEIFLLEERMQEAAIAEAKERLKERLKEIRNRIFEAVLPEAFACVREAAKRTVGMRHFDVQILGGVVLHQGKIVEMATGEGKTLVATLPAYLNALTDRGVHIITVNDYLAKRDREWMGPIYEFLGLKVGVIQHDMGGQDRRAAYACDITYGTNNEFGFDYLRDNMVIDKNDCVQRELNYAIVDEVDSILIDEARTPLIISGPTEESTDKYFIVDGIVPRLKGRFITQADEIEAKYKGEDLSRGYDYVIDEKAQTCHLSDEGEMKAAKALDVDNLHEIKTMDYRHHLIQALRAHNLFKRDVDYVLKDGNVVIVDEFTGRLMPGRRWSDGLHQAIEAKEGLRIEKENQTLATITFQNYFRMYKKLAGMTGTAYTESQEFKDIYRLDCVVIPTNRPLVRTNFSDCVYKTEKEKFEAIVEEISQWHAKGRPILVGTISIEKSEILSERLKMRGIPHNVLNAKYHEMEAQIVAQAGRHKAVTIATNMAGRGTDILLGGNAENMARNLKKEKRLDPAQPEYKQEYLKLLEGFTKEAEEEHNKVVALGGLHVIGTERHEARRIDNQLRGRAGRQGDPGSSRFYVSLEDDLLRLFGSDRLVGIMEKLGLEEGQVIEHPWVTKSIEIAQRRVESHNFEIRKQLLEYDNVMNKQREVIYTQRQMVLKGEGLKDYLLEVSRQLTESALERYLPREIDQGDWDWSGLGNWLRLKFGLHPINLKELTEKKQEEIKEAVYKELVGAYEAREKSISRDDMRNIERMIFLQVLDSKWKDHLYTMDYLKEGIGLRAYGQRDPLIEYQQEGFNMFSQMLESIKEEVVDYVFKVRVKQEEKFRGVFVSLPQELMHQELSSLKKPQPTKREEASSPRPIPPPTYAGRKVGRNEPCPCGSKKKFKKCCGR